jgi:hypothetical protein
VLGPQERSSEIDTLRDALLASPRPRSVLSWLHKSPVTAVLRRIGTGELPLSHDTFESHLSDRSGDFVRALCGAVGALPQRSVELARFDKWLDVRLASRPHAGAVLVRSFATWQVRRRLQRLADSHRLTTSQTRNARQSITVTLRLIDWLDSNGRELKDLDQALLDTWLTTGSTVRYHIRPFIVWSRQQSLVRSDLRVPEAAIRRPLPTATRDDRVELVRRLLDEQDIELHVRVAGLLVLLYGQIITRVALLTHDAIEQRADGVSLRLGSSPVQLPERVARLVVELRDRPLPTSTQVRGEHAWLFPGLVPGRPMVAHALQQAMSRQGIPARPNRNGSLIDLAASMPAPVLADLLDLSPGIAQQWTQLARGDWRSYVGQRAAGPREHAGPPSAHSPPDAVGEPQLPAIDPPLSATINE